MHHLHRERAVTQSSSPRRLQLLVDDDGIAHHPWMTIDEFQWYSTLCEKEHPGPLVQCTAITCIECLVKQSRD